MELQGQVESIIFNNETNGYTVCEFAVDKQVIVAVGYLPFVTSGDFLKVNGKYIVHAEYGEQFKIDAFEKIMPETLDSLEKHLSSGVIKGLGPSTAKNIIKKFGEETLHVLRFEYEKLSEIKGISDTRAREIGEEFNINWDLWQLVGFLDKFGVSANNAKKVHTKLGNNAIVEIEKNPYILIDLVYNVDFKILDKLALNNGLDKTSDARIESGIKYALKIASLNGNCCIIKENLITYVTDLLYIEEIYTKNNIINLTLKSDIIIEKRNDNLEWVYLKQFYKAEKNIAETIFTLISNKNIKKFDNYRKDLEILEKQSKILLSQKQKEAVQTVIDNNVCIITGGPGTGKTTIIKTIVDIFINNKMKVALAAPTGRAAKKMTETTGLEAKTLHRILEIGKISEEENIIDVDIDITPIDADVVIVDEVSMVDVFLMNYLLKAIYLGTKLVLVGDVDQLPSVGPGNILKDLISSEKITTIRLNKIFRQAAKSKIIVNAHKVNNGETFFENKAIEGNNDVNKDFFFINENNQENMINTIISLCKDRIKNYIEVDSFKNIQILTPSKKGLLGTRELNIQLQNALNPKNINKKERTYGQNVYRIDDKVMQIKNNYDIYWEKQIDNKRTDGKGVFNGDFGIITAIDEELKQLKIKFDDEKEVWYQYGELEQIEHSYAITIHKSQGSEFDVVIMPISQASQLLLTRNLLYTGITRAKKLLIIIGNKNVIEFMINNIDSKKRNTGLEYKIKNLQNNNFML